MKRPSSSKALAAACTAARLGLVLGIQGCLTTETATATASRSPASAPAPARAGSVDSITIAASVPAESLPRSALEFPDFTLLPVLYGTDRRPERSLESWRTLKQAHGSAVPYFGRAITNGYELGVCWVTVPTNHTAGQVERPRLTRLEFREDLSKHFTLFNLEPLPANEFIARINRSLDPDRGRHAFIFIHGFNVEFHEAAMRAAQLAHDWQFPGPTILFSWASQGDPTPKDYVTDGETAMGSSARHFERFLVEVMSRTGTTNLHLLAHSMGNRVMTLALSHAPESLRQQINQVVFAAPDVRTDVFADNFPLVTRVARRATLYASSHDRALLLARSLQNDYPRAGLGGDDLVLLPDLESIDASALNTDMLGHSYLTDAREMLADLRQLLLDGVSPDARGLPKAWKGAIPYWRIPSRP